MSLNIRPRLARDSYSPPSRIARDNVLGASDPSSQFGWLGAAVTEAGNTRRWAISLVPENEVTVDQAFPLQMLYDTPAAVLSACKIAVAGVGVKSVISGLMAAAGADSTFTPLAANTLSFGLRFTIGDNVTTFKFGTYTVQILNNGVNIGTIYIMAKKQPIDMVVFAITNVGGNATIVGNAVPAIKVIGSVNGSPTVTASTAVWAETLNMRDLGRIQV